ncbi:hypothetical protein ACFXCZ_07875 [Streptomyces sp. NPDC059396]|uniref:hypothetical protein n=1 Tax=Streptomyces sp. NPDC059396 TaxID=3346819 RepID=UPI0036C3E9AA
MTVSTTLSEPTSLFWNVEAEVGFGVQKSYATTDTLSNTVSATVPPGGYGFYKGVRVAEGTYGRSWCPDGTVWRDINDDQYYRTYALVPDEGYVTCGETPEPGTVRALAAERLKPNCD